MRGSSTHGRWWYQDITTMSSAVSSASSLASIALERGKWSCATLSIVAHDAGRVPAWTFLIIRAAGNTEETPSHEIPENGFDPCRFCRTERLLRRDQFRRRQRPGCGSQRHLLCTCHPARQRAGAASVCLHGRV